ncbi:MAG TPA: hypothetical protein VEB69_09210 [Acidimicrobiia bacterium]|nr:hypothetical protein [Acidimicrobiia bacterium]
MFEEVVLFVTIAEIAGVFVGFAALISVTRRDDIEASQLAQIRAVVTSGLLVVVAALVPVGLAFYHVEGHGLWVTASVVYLILNWVVIYLALQRSANREQARAQARQSPVGAAFFWLLELAIQVPLLLIVFGVNRDLDVAFYMTALVFHLFEAVFILVQLVYAQAGRHRA